MSPLIKKKKKNKRNRETCLTQTWNEFIAATALVYVKFGVQSSLKINTCVCLSDSLCGFYQGEKKKINLKAQQLVQNRCLKSVLLIWIWKIHLSDAERPCSVWLFDANNEAVDAYPFYLSNHALLC